MHTTLISPAALAAHLDDPQWVILDCRHDLMNPDAGRAAFAVGHISNAQFADMDRELSGPKKGEDGAFRGRHPLPERAVLIDRVATGEFLKQLVVSVGVDLVVCRQRSENPVALRPCASFSPGQRRCIGGVVDDIGDHLPALHRIHAKLAHAGFRDYEFAIGETGKDGVAGAGAHHRQADAEPRMEFSAVEGCV